LAYVARHALFDLLLAAPDLALREVVVATVHGLELAAVDGNAGFRQQAHLAAQGDKARANLLDRGTIVLAEVGDGFVIRNEPPGQPHHFQIAASLTLQTPARLDPVQIAVDVKLEHRRRMIRRPAGRCRIDTVKPEVTEFQRIDEHIDRPNRIALVDPILKAFWQQRRLPAIQSRHKACHLIPADSVGEHGMGTVSTQPGPKRDIVSVIYRSLQFALRIRDRDGSYEVFDDGDT